MTAPPPYSPQAAEGAGRLPRKRAREPGHVEVVAGVIRDVRGRILLARRTEGRDLAGLWEFPGGKHEPDETPEAALKRELHEELGIEIELGDAADSRAAGLPAQAVAPGCATTCAPGTAPCAAWKGRRWRGYRRTNWSTTRCRPPTCRSWRH